MFDAFITYHVRQLPERNAIVTPGGSLTFAELDAMVNRFARAPAELGVSPDAVVAVQLANPVTHWLVLLALCRLGIAAACGAGPAATLRIPDQALVPGVADAFHASDDWVRSVSVASPEPLAPARPNSARLGRVLLSAGTTGVQKRIGVSWALLSTDTGTALPGDTNSPPLFMWP